MKRLSYRGVYPKYVGYTPELEVYVNLFAYTTLYAISHQSKDMSTKKIKYPTPQHQQASEAIVEFFSKFEKIKAILLVGSCARNKASKGSCIDMAVLLEPQSFVRHKKALENKWQKYYKTSKVFKDLLAIGKYSHVDLDFINGKFSEGYHGWTSGPDTFELEIGNFLQYSLPLYESGSYLNGLKKIWLPYYGENRRLKRLRMVLKYCHNNLDHIPSFVDRGLYFQAFNRFYDAYREFLQALFISKKIYPIAYDKWIKGQLVDILKDESLYKRVVKLFVIDNIESNILKKKRRDLKELISDYID